MSKKKKLQIRNSTAEFLTFAYQSKGDGVEVRVQDEGAFSATGTIRSEKGQV